MFLDRFRLQRKTAREKETLETPNRDWCGSWFEASTCKFTLDHAISLHDSVNLERWHKGTRIVMELRAIVSCADFHAPIMHTALPSHVE
jgi:hypothetical protein